MAITTKQFQILSDLNLVWDFMVDIYDRERGSGKPAPFFEHALTGTWFDSSYTYLDRLWLDGDKVVAFVFYESPITTIIFSVRRGYEFLADELVDYAEKFMPSFNGEQRLVAFNGQEFLMETFKKRGYEKVDECEDMIFDFKNELSYPLPKGYHFVEKKDLDVVKLATLCWYGFDHADKGDFVDFDKQDLSYDWTPAKSFKGVIGPLLCPSPHETQEFNVVIANDNEEYVCYAGMWWVPENKLAYLEPLCTLPSHRRRGLAAAALTKMYHTLKPLGATHMAGGDNPFYKKIGYGKGWHWTFWKKPNEKNKKRVKK